MRLRWTLLLLVVAGGCGNKASGGCPTTAFGQAAGQPCCPNFEANACVSGYFCAALDSSSPTCQANGSRSDMTACTGDSECASGSCNLVSPSLGECRSQTGMPCLGSIGCAGKSVCVSGASGSTCQAIGNGSTGAVCAMGSDCASHQCNANRCLGDLGQPCTATSDCATGSCQPCGNGGFDNVHCVVPSDAGECLRECGTVSGATNYSRCLPFQSACLVDGDCEQGLSCTACTMTSGSQCLDTGFGSC